MLFVHVYTWVEKFSDSRFLLLLPVEVLPDFFYFHKYKLVLLELYIFVLSIEFCSFY